MRSIKVKIGATDNSKAVVLDCINCSDQLIKKKGIIFPIIPIRVIKMTNLKLRLKSAFCQHWPIVWTFPKFIS